MKIERYTYPDELYYDEHHAYAHIKHAIHLISVNIALLLNELENRWDSPCPTMKLCCHTLGQNPGHIIN